jgi:glucosamine-phosphate N-acetyltransferase
MHLKEQQYLSLMNNFRLLKKIDYNKGFPNIYNQLSKTPHVSRTQFNNFINTLNENHNIYVLEVNNKIVACATFLIEQKLLRGISKVLHIEDVVVDESCRGNGVGKDIIQFLTNIAKNNGCYKIILNCDDDHVGFYKKCALETHGNLMSLYFN